jgi:hypothetical protein
MRRTALVIACSVLFAVPAAAEDWNYDFVLYGWMTGMEGTIGVANIVEEPVDVTFDDLAGYLDFAMAGHFEAKQTSKLFVADIAYANLGAERDATVADQPVTVDMDLTQWIIEAGGAYRATPEFDLFIVGRYYIIEQGATTSSVLGESTPSVSKDWGDLYIGGRYTKILKEKWIMSLRADVGAGGSEIAWFGNAAIG